MSWQFEPLNQTYRTYQSLFAAPNGDIYCGTSTAPYVYRRPSGESTFLELESALTSIGGLAGVGADVYRSVNGGGSHAIQKRTGGAGAFVDYNTNSDRSSTTGMVYSPYSGYMYYVTYNGAGVYRFLPGGASSQGVQVWDGPHQIFHIAISTAGDLYITTWTGNGPGGSSTGYCYKQVGESGSFITLSDAFPETVDGTSAWMGVGAAKNGDVYISDGSYIYRQAAGESLFYRFQTLAYVRAFSGADDGSVYACVNAGDIYMLRSPVSKLKHYAQIIG